MVVLVEFQSQSQHETQDSGSFQTVAFFYFQVLLILSPETHVDSLTTKQTPPAREGRSSSDTDPMVICPDVTAFAAPSSSYSQLFKCTQHLNSALNERQTADAASQAYSNLGDTPRLLLDLSDHGGCTKDTSLTSPNDRGNTPSYFPDKYLEAIRGWQTCLRGLHDRLQASLLSTYSMYEGEVTDSMAGQFFNDHMFRARALQKMKQSKVPLSRSMRADDGLSTFETRFGTYENVKEDLVYIHSLLQLGESGISLGRSIQEITISQRGDAVLEFANNESDSHPVLRFRVLSHMLSETSPLFARIFDSGGSDSGHVLKEGFVPGLPQNPVEYTWSDGTQTRLYRMPQLELNAHGSFALLMHAAHLHNASVPREIEFDTFVALAKVCMRYQCTSPVEMFVEYRWLPQWMHKAIDDMPDGLLLISYAFGLRRLFTRMSKTAILHVVDEGDLQAKPWPQKMKDRIWAVRTAKMGQVLECCSSALQEYLSGPATSGRAGGGSDDDYYDKKLGIGGGVVTPSKPRCPKGNPCCDATNLGWLMILFAQLQILPHIMHSPAVAHLPPPSRRSLHQIFDSLRSIVSPPQGHGGVCEYVPTFRGAVNDISNSVQGLTLFEVSGQHGWALSRHKVDLPQLTFTTTKGAPPAAAAPMMMMAAKAQTTRDAATAKVALRIMEYVDTPRDLDNVAMVSKAFYTAYHSNAEYISRRMNHEMENPDINNDSNLHRNGVLEEDGGDSVRKDQQKVLIYDGDDDDNSTMVDHDFTPPPSEIHDERQQLQGTAKVMREESDRLLQAPMNGNDGEKSRSRGDIADHQHPGPAASLYPTKLLSSSAATAGSSGDGTQVGRVWKRRNEEGTEKFLASEVAAHFVVAASSAVVVAPVSENKNLVVMEDKNLREQRDRKVGILL
ncbi:hypothetical protein PG994_007691 [Apiospora phragmitis]|uniref:BTB domain-containing protein n=1 Tax=Apiospora phragmitis TaxID=2905665 RepID=A0ABR1UTG3_9PEZI